MNKAQLVAAVDAALGDDITEAEAKLLVETIIDIIARQVAAGETVKVTGFGVFERQHRAARPGRNPHTGEAVVVAATTVAKFRPSAQFRDIVAGRREIARTGQAIARAKPSTATTPAATKTATTTTAKRTAPSTTSQAATQQEPPVKTTPRSAAKKQAKFQ